jgi:hypothetical protein
VKCKLCGHSLLNNECPMCKGEGDFSYSTADDIVERAFEKFCNDSKFPGSLEKDDQGEFTNIYTAMLWAGFEAGWVAMGEQF